MTPSTRKALVGLFAVWQFSVVLAHANADELSDGAALAKRIYDRADGQDAAMLFTMTLTATNSTPRQRLAYSFRRDGKNGEVQSLLRFDSPADIRGTGLLVHSRADGSSDQWLYLPALDQVRRIASDRRGGRFVGSDIYYEDLEDRRPDRDRHRLLGQEQIEDLPTQLLESVPIDATKSVYRKRLAWIHEPTLLPVRVDFFESDDKPRKRLTVHKMEQIQGYWTITDSTMTDLTNGHQTRISVQTVRYDQNLPESLCTTQTLADPAIDGALRPQ